MTDEPSGPIEQHATTDLGVKRHQDLLAPILDRLLDFGVCIFDVDGYIVSASQRVRVFLGYEEPELIGKHAEVLFTPEDRAAGMLRDEIELARREGKADNRRWGLRKDGSRVFVEGTLLALYDEHGSLNGFAKVMRDETNRTRAETALRDSELRYRNLFESLDEGFCIVEVLFNASGEPVDLRFLARNPAFEEASPMEAFRVGAEQGTDPMVPRDAFWYDAFTKALTSPEPVRQAVHEPARERWYEVRAWRTDSQKSTQVTIVFSDVTANRTSEARVRESEERYRALFELSPVAVYLYDRQGTLQEYNHSALELWGQAPSVGERAQRFGGPFRVYGPDGEALSPAETPMARVVAEDAADVPPGELIVERPDGRRRTVMAFHRAVRDAAGAVVGGITSLVDITEQKRSEELLRSLNEELERRVEERTNELRMSQTRFRQVFDVGPVAACIFSVDDGRILQVNPSFGRLTGYEASAVVGRTTDELELWTDDRDPDRFPLGGDAQGGKRFNAVQATVRTKSGERRDILMSGELITLDQSSAWLAMFTDVTDRKRTQEQLVAAIEAVMTDAGWFSASIVQRLAELREPSGQADDGMADLTPRERQVLELLATGHADAEIAAALGIARVTVRNYIASLYGKLDVHSRAEAVVWARERAILS